MNEKNTTDECVSYLGKLAAFKDLDPGCWLGITDVGGAILGIVDSFGTTSSMSMPSNRR